MKDRLLKISGDLQSKFEELATLYALCFCIKHDLYFKYWHWVGDDIGGILCVSDYYINFDDIRTDIDLNVQEDKFFNWYDYALIEHQSGNSPVNYKTSIKLTTK